MQLAVCSIKVIQASSCVYLTEDDVNFLKSNKVWIAPDRSRARLCVEFFFSSRIRHTRCLSDWSSDVCSSDLVRPGDSSARRPSALRSLGSLNVGTRTHSLAT